MAEINEIYVAEFDGHTTVNNFIKKYKGSQADCFDLIINDQIVPEHIKMRDAMQLKLRERQVKFIVRISNGSSIPVEFGLSKTIKSLKDYLHDVKKVPVDQQRMTLDRKDLNDELTLNDCKIGNDSVLLMNAVNNKSVMPTESNYINVNLQMKDTDTVFDLINIWKVSNAENYDLVVNGKVVPRNMTLRDANVSKNSKLELQERKISFTITIFNGSRIRVSFLSSKTILDLKKYISTVEDIPVDRQRLTFEGTEMEDHLTLHHYGVKDDSTVHLNLHLVSFYDVHDLGGRGGLKIPFRDTLLKEISLEICEGGESLATIGSILDDSINLDISRDGGISKSSTFDRAATVEDVIRSVERGYSDDYDLEYNGRVWSRDMQLRDAYMPNNGRVKIVEKKVKITVKNASNGRKFPVDMPKSATVKQLKNKLREYITIDNPRISFNGNELSDTKTLRDYNIQKNSELTVISRCYGA